MPFYAHSANASGASQLLTDHIRGVTDLSMQFAHPLGMGETARVLGTLHDIGKYDSIFQDVLTRKRIHVNHRAAGAAIAMELYERDQTLPPMLADILYAHHGELGANPSLRALLARELSGAGEPLDENNDSLTLFGQAALTDAMKSLQLTLPRPPAVLPASWLEDDSIRRMLRMRLLLSALVDADYCDTARHYGQPVGDEILEVDAALAALEAKHAAVTHSSASAPALNVLREKLYADCAAAGDSPQGLYTLTAPTGMGKTLSLLAFALRHAKCHRLKRIFIILPYLSLMQQNVAVYREIIPNLLESHSMANWNETTKLASQRWDAPLIVTTSVQFFESLFQNRAPDCRKLHQLAQSVVVFDEAQTLPAQLLTPTLQTLRALNGLAGCTVVFSTATQPSYAMLRDVDWPAQEIVPNVNELYGATRRAQVDWRMGGPIEWGELANSMAKYPQCLAIVNLRRHARALTQALEPLIPDGSLFYLTTDLCPAHRTEVLAAVRGRLAAGLPCTVIATQCVEAGVDLDFPVLYRALAPLESIIQASGRCNRNGCTPDGRVTVFLPGGEGTLYPDPWYQWGAECVKILLSKGPVDLQDPETIKTYFDLCYRTGAPDNPELIHAIEARDFPTTARKYRLIDDDQYHVVVPYGNPPVPLQTLLAVGLDAGKMRALQPFTVSTYDRALLDGCEAIPLHVPGDRPTADGSRWYWLDRPNLYDSQRYGLHRPIAPETNLY